MCALSSQYKTFTNDAMTWSPNWSRTYRRSLHNESSSFTSKETSTETWCMHITLYINHWSDHKGSGRTFVTHSRHGVVRNKALESLNRFSTQEWINYIFIHSSANSCWMLTFHAWHVSYMTNKNVAPFIHSIW